MTIPQKKSTIQTCGMLQVTKKDHTSSSVKQECQGVNHDKHFRPVVRKTLSMLLIPRTTSRKTIFSIALIMFALLMIPFVSAHAQCSSSLTNYWKLDESTGSTFADSIGGADAGCSSSGCPSSFISYINNAWLFDGSNGLNVSSQASFNWVNTDSFSIEFWMKTDSGSTCAGNQVIVGRDDGLFQWWVGCQDGGQAAFNLYPNGGTGGGVSGTKTLTDGFWHHIVAVRDYSAGKIELYVDGVSEASLPIAFSGSFVSTTASLNIGWLNRTPYFHFEGAVDEVALYNSALSVGEIRSHYYLARGYCDLSTVKIMPLGDSITQGYNVDTPDNDYMVSYRQKLYRDLIDGGYDVQFVGNLSSGEMAQPPNFDIYHNGQPGWCADGCSYPYYDIKDNVYNFLNDQPSDVVLLHIGTNDISVNNENAAEVAGILDEIDSYSPKVTVILARIITRLDGKAAQTTTFNNAVEAMALQRIANGDKIIIVDMEGALDDPGDMADALHPSQTGYEKMATVWFNTLQTLLPLSTAKLLTVQKNGTGQGTVTSDPVAINCGSTCSASFPQGTVVDLTAEASSGSTFTSWTGCDSVNGNVCTVTMTADKSVTAVYTSSNRFLYADFTDYNGLWQWSGSAWTQLTGAHPTNMVTSNGILYADFTDYNGLWQWSGSAWTQLTGAHPTNMVTSNGILYADFTDYNGLWQWSGSAWTQLTGAHPTNMVTGF
jgi:hypothetical protein